MITESLKEKLIQDVADEVRKRDRLLSVKTSMSQAKQRVGTRWNKESLYLLSGKTIIKRLSAWSQTNYGISFNALNLVRCFHPDEVPEEVKSVVLSIIEGKEMPIK
jgi:hypothetical protein